jgi:hypothetical protein
MQHQLIGPLGSSLRDAPKQSRSKSPPISPSKQLLKSSLRHTKPISSIDYTSFKDDVMLVSTSKSSSSIRVRTEPRMPGQPAISIRRSSSANNSSEQKTPDKAAANFFAIVSTLIIKP